MSNLLEIIRAQVDPAKLPLFDSIQQTLRINNRVLLRANLEQHRKSIAITANLLKKTERELGESVFCMELDRQLVALKDHMEAISHRSVEGTAVPHGPVQSGKAIP